jgi:hypothetical protein
MAAKTPAPQKSRRNRSATAKFNGGCKAVFEGRTAVIGLATAAIGLVTALIVFTTTAMGLMATRPSAPVEIRPTLVVVIPSYCQVDHGLWQPAGTGPAR